MNGCILPPEPRPPRLHSNATDLPGDIVVVGAGPAGARCAERLAEGGANVLLIGAEHGLPYNRVALTQLLAGDLDEAALVTHDEARLHHLRVRHQPATRISAIDRRGRLLRTESGGAIAFGALVLALGAQAIRLPLPGADLPGVMLYRTLQDVRAMMDVARRGGPAVVIGGGLLGLEAAVGLARRSMDVVVVHGADRLMERQLDTGAARLLTDRLADQGVRVLLGAKTIALEGPDRVTGVRLADGTVVPAGLVVMAVGIKPETALARDAGLLVNRGIVVDDSMRTDDPAIYAAGECAEHQGVCVGLVAPALAQADVAAAAILGQSGAYRAVENATALKVAGAGVWSAGSLEGDEAIVLDDAAEGQYRRFLLRDGRRVGAVLYGDGSDAAWYRGLIAEGMHVGALRQALPFGPAFAEHNG